MIVLIPALIEKDAAERQLRATLARLPSAANVTLVLVTQGHHLTPGGLPGVRDLRTQNFPGRIGKWAAIRAGLELVSDRADDPLLLLDADDPVSTHTMSAALARAEQADTDYLIGERSAISLPAAEQSSAHTRGFIEIFSNTLLLQVMGDHSAAVGAAPDIQSGFYILSGKARRHVVLTYVADYGGELALYHELVSSGIVPTPFEIETNAQATSHYNIRGILQSIARLPFFRTLFPVPVRRASKTVHA